jgi:putative ABC transport system substrate-binding protein
MPRFYYLFHFFFAVVLTTTAMPRFAIADSTTLAVIYPEVEEPYLGIFLQIVEGIKERAKGEVVLSRIKGETDANASNAWLRESSAKRAILLGRQGVKLAKQIDPEVRRVVGGALLAPGPDTSTFSGISLTPDPDRLFALLKRLAPSIKRVFVVFNPAQNRWLIEIARDSAKRHGLELVEREAQDLRAAALEYQALLPKVQEKQDALWLPQDSSTVDEGVILPLILKEAWDRNLLVFSSNFANVRKGILFALYPDNKGWGRELADLAYAASAPRIVPLKTLRSAINTRTASHLGLEVDARKFDAVFPEP